MKRNSLFALFVLIVAACSPQAPAPTLTPSSVLSGPAVIDDLAFTSGDVTLVGRLTLPAGEGPFPAVVWVHGSGQTTRDEASPLHDMLVAAGVAVFSYDKRGVGESGGNYSEVVVGQGNRVLGQLAADAAAATDFVATQEQINAAHIGFFGASQAGWVIPQAALLTENVSYVALLSGPTVSVGIENYYSRITPNQGGSVTLEQVETFSQQLSRVQSNGYDPREAIAALEIPGLWILGARDASIPVRETVAILEEINDTLRRDFTVFIYPNANHGMFDAESGIQEPFMTEVLIPWIYETIQR